MKQSKMWTVVAGVAAAAGGIALRQAAERAWQATRGEEPPKTPAARHTTWKEALVWSAVAGVTAGVGRLLARELAAHGWERWTGARPV